MNNKECCKDCKVRPLHGVPPAYDCFNPNCPCHLNTKDWVREFHERFVKISGVAGSPRNWMSLEGEGVKEIEDFVRTLLSQERKRVLESLPKEREVKIIGESGIKSAGDLGYNQALKDVIATLTEELDEKD